LLNTDIIGLFHQDCKHIDDILAVNIPDYYRNILFDKDNINSRELNVS